MRITNNQLDSLLFENIYILGIIQTENGAMISGKDNRMPVVHEILYYCNYDLEVLNQTTQYQETWRISPSVSWILTSTFNPWSRTDALEVAGYPRDIIQYQEYGAPPVGTHFLPHFALQLNSSTILFAGDVSNDKNGNYCSIRVYDAATTNLQNAGPVEHISSMYTRENENDKQVWLGAIGKIYTTTIDNTVLGIHEPALLKDYQLQQNYPNPFNPVTKINFTLPKSGNVSLIIFDIAGKEVATLVNETKAAGDYSVDFNAANLSSGTYFYRLETNGFVETKKMLLLK